MYSIGVDIGGTGIKAGIVNQSGQILFKKDCKTDAKAGFEKIIQDIYNLISELVDENNISFKQIKSIGFGVPGLTDKLGRVSSVNLGWEKVDFLNTIKNKFENIDVYVDNDANVAALAEARAGSMKDCTNGVMYTLGTGVGGGIIINKKIFSGSHNIGSEIGHVIIGENYFDCNCGNNGCVETFCSATAIIKYAQNVISKGNQSLISKFCNNNLDNIDAKIVFDAYRENDEVAIKVITRFKTYLAKAIGGIINILDPDVIAIGGGVSRASDIILDNLEEDVRNYVAYKDSQIANIVIATLGNDAGIIGAAFLS